jgi:hypothetical protein
MGLFIDISILHIYICAIFSIHLRYIIYTLRTNWIILPNASNICDLRQSLQKISGLVTNNQIGLRYKSQINMYYHQCFQ